MTSFEDTLRAALPAAAGQRPTTANDWAMFTAKLSETDQTGTGSWRRWRTPLLAAAAVIIVAGGVVAITTGGLGRNQTAHLAAPGADQSSQDTTAESSDAAATGRTVDGLVFAHHADAGDSGDQALLEGVVADTDGCLTVVAPGTTNPPVVPSFGLPATDPTSLRVGDTVALTGGFTDAETLGEGSVIPEQCKTVAAAADGYFVAWQLKVAGQIDQSGPGSAAGPFVVTYPDLPDMAAPDALFKGIIAVQGGCLVAVPTPGYGDTPVTLVFPESQVEPATAPAVLRFRGVNYSDGDHISVGGSMMGNGPTDLPAGCPTQAWAVSPYS